MTLSINQALEEANTLLKDGKFSDSENYYLAILEIQPDHPDANHNLGILHIQTHNPYKSLPFFLRAIENNPNQNQYWLSYLYALIQVGDFDKTLQVIQSARQSGLSEDEIDALLKTLNLNNPDYIALEELGEVFKNGKYKEAETLALKLLESYPFNGYAWEILGVVLIEMGRNTEALIPLQKATILLPNDSGGHNNLGVILLSLRRPREAEVSLR